MFAISFIHRTGGSKTAFGNSIKECKENAKVISNAFPKTYLHMTLPYAVYKVPNTNMYDVSIPKEIKAELGTELRLILSEQVEGE